MKKWVYLLTFILLVAGVSAVNTADYINIQASNGTTTSVTGVYNETHIYQIAPPTNEEWIISRLIVYIEDAGSFDSGAYGNNINLNNGVYIRLNKSGVLTNLTTQSVLTNADWGISSHDVSIHNFGLGNEYLTNRWTFSKSGTYIKLSEGDSIQVVVENDDYTGLVDHRFTFQGFKAPDNSGGDMQLALIIGIGLLAFMFLYFAFNLDKDHFLLKLMSIFFALFTVVLLPNVFLNGVTETSKTFLRIPLWFFRIFLIYFTVYLFYHWTQKSERWAKWLGKATKK